jgi:hypothetical protein
MFIDDFGMYDLGDFYGPEDPENQCLKIRRKEGNWKGELVTMGGGVLIMIGI